MKSSGFLLTVQRFCRRNRARQGLFVFAVVLQMLVACAYRLPDAVTASSLPPLRIGDSVLTVADATARVASPDLLAMDDDMREFVRRYTDGLATGRQRLMSLHRAVRGSASLGIDYDPSAEGTALEVFHRGSANCLSYATLFVALAREAGLQAQYQFLKVRPQWTLQGERVMVRVHVNVLVSAGRSDKFMVDIDPLPTRDVTGSRSLADADAQALYHANVGMFSLAENRTEEAWLHSVRALQLSPDMAPLWVNIGAVYRYAGQHRDAESSYQRALALDSSNDSAMNNLVVLYDIEGRAEERAYWASKVESYRQTNPYYHAWLGDQAAHERDWRRALINYEKALSLAPENSRLLYALGLAHYELKQPALASGYIRRAIEHATLRSDIDAYQLQLKIVEQGLSAGT